MALVFDTNIWITYQPEDFPKSLFMSVIVLQELVAGAPDQTAVKKYEAVKRGYEREGRLLVPTAEDWFLAGKVLNSLLRGLKSERGGKTPKLHPDEKQRIIRDVLIARTVRRVNGLLITDNLADFRRIKKFCNVRLKSGQEFFAA
ncbi:MAG TPA: type II toxin-antitoxin system VapC family toxin [Pyrinomonadaceae bacterium]|nr:type II toxin-antitoxin system VapC family toxin [Pyrinomonadaceae bacterium]